MQVRSFVWTMGIGMAAGAAIAMVLPKQPQVKTAVAKAADTIEDAVEQAKDCICK